MVGKGKALITADFLKPVIGEFHLIGEG